MSHFKLISDVHLNIYSLNIELNLENFIKNPVLIKKEKHYRFNFSSARTY